MFCYEFYKCDLMLNIQIRPLFQMVNFPYIDDKHIQYQVNTSYFF